MIDLKITHGIFDRRPGSVQRSTRRIRRYEIGDIAHRKQFARLGAGQKGWIDTAVGAGNNQGCRRLAFLDQLGMTSSSWP